MKAVSDSMQPRSTALSSLSSANDNSGTAVDNSAHSIFLDRAMAEANIVFSSCLKKKSRPWRDRVEHTGLEPATF